MAGKTVNDMVTEALATLSEKNLKSFRRQLANRREEPLVPFNEVDGKDYMDVADVVVSTFTEKKAVDIVVEILRKIRCSNQADRLVQEASKQTSQSASTDAAGSLSGATDGSAVADDMHFVDKHRKALIQRVSNVDAILDDLLDKNVIKQEGYGRIRKIPTSEEKMRELYDGPLKAAGRCKKIFYEILQEHEKYLIEELEGKK